VYTQPEEHSLFFPFVLHCSKLFAVVPNCS
jgi:hypothetical protein